MSSKLINLVEEFILNPDKEEWIFTREQIKEFVLEIGQAINLAEQEAIKKIN